MPKLKKDIITKQYISRNDIFSDIINYMIFDGEKIVDEDDLQERDSGEFITILTEKGSTYSSQKLRDLLKACIIKSTATEAYLLIGIENQAEIHNAMVIRNLLYDSLNYAGQVESIALKNKQNNSLKTSSDFLSGLKKDDKLIPVITITILWNSGKWDAPRSLKEMLLPCEPQILNYVNDYKLNLLIPEEADTEKFSTEMSNVMEVLSALNDKEKLVRILTDSSRYSDIENDTAKIISAFTNIKKPRARKGKVDMCKALNELLADKLNEGERKGLIEGERKGLIEGEHKGLILGRNNTLVDLVKDGLISMDVGAMKAGVTVEVFKSWMH